MTIPIMMGGTGGAPTLDLAFTAAGIDPRVTITRPAGGATYFDATGTLQLAAANTARIDYGYAPSGGATNLLFPSVNWIPGATPGATDGAIVAAATAPDGTPTATKIIPGTNNTVHQWFRTFGGTPVCNFVHSIYAKPAGLDFLYMSLDNTGFIQATAIFDLSAGTIFSSSGGTPTITPAGNGYYRCSISGTSSNLGPPYVAVIRPGSTSANVSGVWAGNAFDGMYVWGEQVELKGSNTPGIYVPTTTGIATSGATAIGVLVEESRTNSIANARLEGAIPGTPGTLPTGCTQANSSGLAFNVVGGGSENGLPYVDLSVIGTSTATGVTNFTPIGATVAAALSGQTWTLAPYVRLVAGSLTNIAAVSLILLENDIGGGGLASTNVAITPTGAALATQRTAVIRTLNNPSTAFVSATLSLNINTGLAVNATFRIAAPQLEQGASATTPILPAIGIPAVTTRAADADNLYGGPSLFAATSATIVAEVIRPALGIPGNLFSLINPNAQDVRSFFRNNGTEPATAFETGLVGSYDTAGNYIGIILKHGVAWTPTSFSTADNGISAANQVALTGSLTTPFDTLYLGAGNASVYLNGWLRRIRYWPRALSTAELQAITT